MRTARALNPNAPCGGRGLSRAGARPAGLDRASAGTLGITAHPLGPHAPEIWILGSSDYGAQLAAHFGLPYAFAYFFTDGQGAEQALALYRQLYRPSERHPRAAGDALRLGARRGDARRGAAPRAVARSLALDRARGVLGPLQAPAAIAARGFDAGRDAGPPTMRARAFVGSARTVASARARWSRRRARRARGQHLGPRSGGATTLVRAACRVASRLTRGAARRR